MKRKPKAKKPKVKYNDMTYYNVFCMLDDSCQILDKYMTTWMEPKFKKKFERVRRELCDLSEEALNLAPFEIDYDT